MWVVIRCIVRLVYDFFCRVVMVVVSILWKVVCWWWLCDIVLVWGLVWCWVGVVISILLDICLSYWMVVVGGKLVC